MIRQTQKPWIRFNLFLIVSILISTIGTLFTLIYLLKSAGEFLHPNAILEKQIKEGGLYRSILTDDVMSPFFKISRYQFLQPQIIALGSSRVLQFRQKHFTKKFSNMGMSLDYALLPGIVDELIEKNTNLELVIFGLDHWQVDEKAFPNVKGNHIPEPNFFNKFIAAPIRLLMSARLSLNDIEKLVCNCDKFGEIQNIGAAAKLDGSGIDAHGSYHYDWVYEMPAETIQFQKVLSRIKNSTNGFHHSDKIFQDRFEIILSALNKFTSRGVQVIVYIPPMAPTIVSKMKETKKFGILEQLSLELSAVNLPFQNYHDPVILNSNDCEFVDGFHGGEITHLRILQDLYLHYEKVLKPYIDIRKIDQLILSNSGKINSYATPKSGDKLRSELDFLGLGCAR